MSKIGDMMILYDLEHPDALHHSGYGLIRWMDFLNLEAQRIGRNPDRKIEIFQRGEFYGLKVDRVA